MLTKLNIIVLNIFTVLQMILETSFDRFKNIFVQNALICTNLKESEQIFLTLFWGSADILKLPQISFYVLKKLQNVFALKCPKVPHFYLLKHQHRLSRNFCVPFSKNCPFKMSLEVFQSANLQNHKWCLKYLNFTVCLFDLFSSNKETQQPIPHWIHIHPSHTPQDGEHPRRLSLDYPESFSPFCLFSCRSYKIKETQSCKTLILNREQETFPTTHTHTHTHTSSITR